MAGIGFLLRKLATQDNLSGIIRAFFHSAVVAVGPWIMIILALGSVHFFTIDYTGFRELQEFQAIILYNFLFSFILSAPLYMISARYVADCLFRRDAFPIPGILITSLTFLLLPSFAIALFLYGFYATMSGYCALFSIINFVLLSQIWIIMLYLGCIRNFRAITLSWAGGMILTLYFTIGLGRSYGTTGMMLGLNIGLALLLFSLLSNIMAEYPYRLRKAKEFHYYFRQYSGLFWSGFFLFSGMWVDKVLMWFSPEATMHANGLVTCHIYDGAMFLSYLSIIPVLSLFIFSLETNFYESYILYLQHIERNTPLSLIEQTKNEIIKKIGENGRSFLILQGTITLLIIAITPEIFQWMKADFAQVSIFRLGTLGAFFGALNLIIVIFFSYFDSQNNMMIVSSLMFFSNVVFTLISQQLGFSFYGYGYCLSMILTFFVAATLFIRFLNKLTYNIFITNVVKHRSVKERFLENKSG
ncbi:MAG: exopolysaccharide Pel transporter PelG [Chlamydiae bacterium]|nr:exopolysaccharide Pel transporter PelG [Chlamydiota bacterium]